MIPKRPYLLAATSLCVAIAACGSSNGDDTVTPEGTHYGYVVSKPTVVLPAPHVSTEYGLDLGTTSSTGGATSSKLDGKIDNKLGTALQILSGLGFDIQGTIETAIATGNIILLLDFQTKDFTTASASGLSVKFGDRATASPQPCSSPTDMTCGHHLDGSATFQLAASSPTNAELTGKVTGGTFSGGPGEVSLQLAIGSTDAIQLNLVHARVQATNLSATGMTAIIGGLLTVEELKTSVGSGLEKSVAALIAANCTQTMPPMPPGCGCTGSALLVMMQADGTAGRPQDCKLEVEELLGNPIVAPLVSPDSCSKDSCAMADAVSLGIKVDAVKATFPM